MAAGDSPRFGATGHRGRKPSQPIRAGRKHERNQMERRLKLRICLGVGAAVGLLAGAATVEEIGAQSPPRTLYLAAVEPKGGTTVEKEPFPAAPLPPGPGYVRKAPDASGRWEVSAYQWSPGTIVAYAGERLTLEVIGINGDIHPSYIEGHAADFVVKRGEVSRVTFTAGKPGIYPIVCRTHLPSMQGSLVVLPRP
jgi:plastocyanin